MQSGTYLFPEPAFDTQVITERTRCVALDIDIFLKILGSGTTDDFGK